MGDMVTIKIDGKKISARRGANLLEAARHSNILIPSLCYHRKLTPTGACRLCITKIREMSGFVAACTVSVQDGMEVTAFDEELEETRRYLLDYLLSEHSEASDLSYDDEFKVLVTRYGLDDPAKRQFPSLWQSLGYPVDDSSPVLTYDAAKCIKCFRCIKACDEVQGKNVLSFTNRGITSYIIGGFGVWGESECDGCGECVQLCPTGAIVEKPNRNILKTAEADTHVKTICPYCGVGCQLELAVKNNRIVRVNGVEGVKPNDGRLCVKGRFGYEYVGSRDRLTRPLIKNNGQFVEAGWDTALDYIAAKFKATKENYGNDALAGYASAKCTNEDNYIFQKFIRTAFGTNNVDYCTRLCHASTVTAMLRSLGDGAGSNSIEDYETADCILVIGNNMIETHPVTATFVKRGIANGAKLIVIDPKWTPLVKFADVWLQPRLGTDVALLNGLMHIIISENLIDKIFIENRVEGGIQAFDKLKKIVSQYTPEMVSGVTGVAPHKLQTAAGIYARSSKALIATGMGISQQVSGTHTVFALINMCLIVGQIGKTGAGLNPPRGQNNVQGASDVGCSPLIYPGYIPVTDDDNRKKVAAVWDFPYEALSGKIGLTTVEIMQAAHGGKVKGMYIMGENPMLTDPNQNHTREALERLEFLVVQDIFATDTTALADVILPGVAFAEKNGTFVNSDRRVSRVRKAVDPPGKARQDWEVLWEVAKRMGCPIKSYQDESVIFDEIAAVAPIMAGISHDRIEQEGIQWPCPTKDHPGTRTLFLDKFNTPSGRAILNPVDYVPQNEKTTAGYPFLLNTGRILYHFHSSTMSRRNQPLTDFANQSYVLMHPDDAKKLGLEDGQRVSIASRQGEIDTRLKVSSEVQPAELFMPFHYSESPVNRLTRDDLDPHSKIAPFKLTACRVEKCIS
ncbi:NAD-dependent formate dehydrogenase alpha subunit @ selenocysteine-containing [Olavius sp. associated proteobacterium Delta 1]|nr:NAD-dependent formate dehydrogenase alpha subunit @ selenocysteine-containing [Olavius sp. associated proteobacterium Delta 1]